MSPRASEDKTRTNPHFIPQAPEPLNHVCFKLNFKSVSWAKNAKTTFLSCTLKKKKNYRTQSDFQVLRKLNQTLLELCPPCCIILYVAFSVSQQAFRKIQFINWELKFIFNKLRIKFSISFLGDSSTIQYIIKYAVLSGITTFVP